MHDFNHFIELADNLAIKYEKMAKTSSIVSFKVGGTSSIVAYPNSIEQFIQILKCIKSNQYKFCVVGNGTNVYFTDQNYNGIVICAKGLNKISVTNNYLVAECGASLNSCAVASYNNSLSGLEFAYGIPGTIGGGIFMNASAFGKSISMVVYESIAFDLNSSKIVELSLKEHKFDDKQSVFMDGNYIILTSRLKLDFCDKELIKAKMTQNLDKRIKSQPLNLPSAGSAFKRPKGDFASRLIDEAGLKGLSVGGAMVSKMHAGFIVNTGNATANDINKLICIIQNIIFEKYGIMLDKEIIFLE